MDKIFMWVDQLSRQNIFDSFKKNNWYWEKQPLQHTIIVTTHTIIHPRLDVVGIIYVKDIPKNVCNRIQFKKLYKDIIFV